MIHDIKFIISCSESLAEYMIKTKISHRFFKYWDKYGNEHTKKN